MAPSNAGAKAAGEAARSRRDEILDVASELFSRRGFAGASMRDLARGVGFTQGALYFHFRTKEEILFEISERFLRDLQARLQHAMDASGDPLQGLQEAVRLHIMLARTNSRETKLVLEDVKLLGKPHAKRIRRFGSEIYAMYRNRVAELIAAGRFRRADAAVIAFNILAIVNFIFQWYRPDGRLDLEEVAQESIDMLIAGMLARPAARGATAHGGATRAPARARRTRTARA